MQHLLPPVRFADSVSCASGVRESPCVGDRVAVFPGHYSSLYHEGRDAHALRGFQAAAHPAPPVLAPGSGLNVASEGFRSSQCNQSSLASLHDFEQPIQKVSEPMQSEDQQFYMPHCWAGRFHQDDHSLPAVSGSVAAHEPISLGSATAEAECAAAIADILDSFGGPVSSTGWNRLARKCYASNGEVTSQQTDSPSASSHQITAHELEWYSQQSQQVQAFVSDHSIPDDNIMHLGSPSHAHRAAPSDMQDSCMLSSLHQPPSCWWPSPLPIWSLDIPSYTMQNVPNLYSSPLPFHANTEPVQPMSIPWLQPHEQELSLSLSVLPSMPASDAQVAMTSSAASAATATGPSAAAAANDPDGFKAKKKKGTGISLGCSSASSVLLQGFALKVNNESEHASSPCESGFLDASMQGIERVMLMSPQHHMSLPWTASVRLCWHSFCSKHRYLAVILFVD